MEYEKNVCPVLDVDGVLATGKQFDLDITLPEDNRSVIYGVVKDCCQEPIRDAVVKLVEVVCDCGKEERRPVSHTFTDKEGEFVFGPLCPNRFYEIEIWVDQVKHCKICTKAERDGKCLKGVKLDCKKDDFRPCHKDECECHKEECKHCHKECHKDECDCKKDEHKPYHKDECECHKEECKPCRKDDYDDDKCMKDKDDKCCKEDKECDKKEDKCDKRPCRPCFRPF